MHDARGTYEVLYPFTAMGRAPFGKMGADATNWKKFTPTMRPTDERIAAFTAACAAKGVLVMATANDEGHVEIARAGPGPGAAAGIVPWAVVKAAAPGIFGPCTSVTAAKGHNKGTMPMVLRLRRQGRRGRGRRQCRGPRRDHESGARPWRGSRNRPMGHRQGRRAGHLWPVHVGDGSRLVSR